MSGVLAVFDLERRTLDRRMLAELAGGLAVRRPGDLVWGTAESFGWAAASLRGRLRLGEAIAGPSRGRWLLADARIDARDELAAASGQHDPVSEKALADAELLLDLFSTDRLGSGSRDLLPRLVGEFAFAAFDRERHRLLAARDLFGHRPCFYAEIEGTLLVTNTLACLHRHPRLDVEPDRESIAAFLATGENPRLDATFVRGVRRLPPGHRLDASRAGVRVRRFADLHEDGSISRRGAEVIEGFADRLRAAVRDRLRGGRSSVFMSGGLDSTSVAATARSLFDDARSRLLAVTGTYERLLPDSEGHYARLAAGHLGIGHAVLAADEVELYASWEAPRPRPIQPTVDALCIGEPMLRAANDHASVALTGLGGDPLFQADPFHLARLLRRGRLVQAARGAVGTLALRRRLPPTGICVAWRRRRPDPLAAYPTWLRPELERRFELRERYAVWQQLGRWEAASFTRTPVGSPARLGLQAALWTNLFESFDPGATELPLRVTHPFFDLRVVRFVLGLPPLPWCVDKALLRTAMRGRLPAAIRLRPKTPLPAYPRHPFPAERRRRIVGLLRNTPELEEFAVVDRVARLIAAGDRVAPEQLEATFPVVALADWLRGPAREARPRAPAAVHHERTAVHEEALV